MNRSFLPLYMAADELPDQSLPAANGLTQNDFHYTRQFLLSYTNSQATFDAYRSEVEKFMQWLLYKQHADLTVIEPEHIKAYLQFLQAIPASWVQQKRCRKFIYDAQQNSWSTNPDWRPFVIVDHGKRAQSSATKSRQIGKRVSAKDTDREKSGNSGEGKKIAASRRALSKNSIASSLRVLSTLFEFLVEEHYIQRNPVKRLRQKQQLVGQHAGQAPVRRLSELQWSYAMTTATRAADSCGDNERMEKERNLFILTLLFGLYLRISELAEQPRWQPQMNHFYKDSDGSWWFKTVGKGNKERDIAVSDAILTALRRYRKALGLSPLPNRSDQSPLVPNFGLQRHHGIRSTRHIRRLVQEMFDQAHDAMIQDGLAEEADEFKVATVHWLRHTGISEDVKTRPREHVRDDAGHSSSVTTDRYIDVERRERHRSGKKKPLDQI